MQCVAFCSHLPWFGLSNNVIIWKSQCNVENAWGNGMCKGAFIFLFICMDNFTNIWKAALLLEQKTSCNILVKLTQYKKQNYDKKYKSIQQGTRCTKYTEYYIDQSIEYACLYLIWGPERVNLISRQALHLKLTMMTDR